MYANKENEMKVIGYIKERFTTDDTVSIFVEPESEWLENDFDEAYRDYKVSRFFRSQTGEVVGPSIDNVEALLEGENGEEHFIQLSVFTE